MQSGFQSKNGHHQLQSCSLTNKKVALDILSIYKSMGCYLFMVYLEFQISEKLALMER